MNNGSEDIYELDLEFPPEAGNFQILDRSELPLRRLLSGKSATFLALDEMGRGGRDHFDVRVTGRTADGTAVDEEAFLSLASG